MAAPVSHSAALSLFKKMNYFKKMPEDLTISTTQGSVLSMVGLLCMALLFILELRAFMAIKFETLIEVDNTPDTMMRINFNVTVDDIPCEYVSVDLTDATGTYEHNITRSVKKTRLTAWRRHIAIHPEEGAGMPAYVKPSAEELAQIAGEASGDQAAAAGDRGTDVHGNPVGAVVPLSKATLQQYVMSHDMVFVNFFAPWCHWCRELEPIWTQTAAQLPDLHYGEHVKMASVDCVAHSEFCREMHIRAFPTLLLYTDHTTEQTLLYRSTRSQAAINEFLETNAQRHHVPHEETAAKLEGTAIAVSRDHGPEGCMVAGKLAAKKVPGTFHVKLHSPQYSHAADLMNVSHVVHHLSFGGEEVQEHAGGIFEGMMDVGKSSVHNTPFAAEATGMTFVHFHKVVARVKEYSHGHKVGSYHYTMHSSSHKEADDAFPSIKFSYDLSPLKVVERQVYTPTYHFITSVCAIIGGFFTLLGLFENSLHYSLETLSKKLS